MYLSREELVKRFPPPLGGPERREWLLSLRPGDAVCYINLKDCLEERRFNRYSLVISIDRDTIKIDAGLTDEAFNKGSGWVGPGDGGPWKWIQPFNKYLDVLGYDMREVEQDPPLPTPKDLAFNLEYAKYRAKTDGLGSIIGELLKTQAFSPGDSVMVFDSIAKGACKVLTVGQEELGLRLRYISVEQTYEDKDFNPIGGWHTPIMVGYPEDKAQ